jgi:hypothetical protein
MKRNTERKPMTVPRLNGPNLDNTRSMLVLKYGINYNTTGNSEIGFFSPVRMAYTRFYLDSIKLTVMYLTNFTIQWLCFRILITSYPCVGSHNLACVTMERTR